MKKLNKTLAVFITAAMILASFATTALAAPQSGTTDDGCFLWQETGDGTGLVAVTGYDDTKGGGGSITIPSTMGGMEVVEIGDSAFIRNEDITDVSFPATIQKIDKDAFSGCENLTDVNGFDSGLTDIGENAFNNTGLTSVTIPAKVTDIGTSAFSSCTYLTSVKFAAASQLAEIGEMAFYNTSMTSITIPASVTDIDASAFKDSGLKKVTFADSGNLANIRDGAFQDTKLTNLTIPESVEKIEANAFDCPNTLTSVVFHNDTVQIDDAAFDTATLKSKGLIYGDSGSTADQYTTDQSFHDRFYAVDLAVGTPEITTAESTGSAGVFVAWSAASFTPSDEDKASCALYYKLYYAKSLADLGTSTGISVTKTYNTITGLTTGSTYYFKVVAYCEKTVDVNNVLDYYGCASDAVAAAPQLRAPSSISAKPATYNSVNLSWSAVSGAAGYKVYRSTSLYGTYTLLKTVTGFTTYSNTGLTTGNTYYYKVCAYVTSTSLGDYTRAVSATPTLTQVTGLTITTSSYATRLILKWTAVTGRTGYEVKRSTDQYADESDWKLVKSTSSTSYTDTSLEPGTKYYYKVTAYRTVSGSRRYGLSSAINNGTPVVSQVLNAKAVASSSSKIKVSWSSVLSRKDYEVWRSEDGGATWETEPAEVLSGTYWYDTGLDSSTTYTYRIRAYWQDPNDDDNIVYGAWSVIASAMTKDAS